METSTGNCWSISEICLWPSNRPHPVSAITTAASWKRETVGRFLKSPRAFQKAASCVFDHDDGFTETEDGWLASEICLRPFERPDPASSIITKASWKRGMVGRFPKSASGLSNGRILYLRLRQRPTAT
ncbi:hypothetical protein GMDG_05104 [Pseudogymnoascus destructans 20631-21]|uniref:Uncharacterized protein n=1 Tax=Pseudogymnoascus destructans (strain ATCC MYA-4855 / 20631-21) TaxID=658429 RepID=L8FQD2_PSED2|nr:hypothetical protein GMDG_05104 [Pseudogymnoascus destructans 20631-21]